MILHASKSEMDHVAGAINLTSGKGVAGVFSSPNLTGGSQIKFIMFCLLNNLASLGSTHQVGRRGEERSRGALLFPARLLAALCSVTVTDGKAQLSCQKE